MSAGKFACRKFALTCNTIRARKCKLNFVCRSPGGKTAPGFSLRGRGHPKNARGGAEHACCCTCYVPVRRAPGFAFSQSFQIDGLRAPVNFTFYREPVPFLLFAARTCSCSVVYRVTAPRQQRHNARTSGRNAAWAQHRPAASPRKNGP